MKQKTIKKRHPFINFECPFKNKRKDAIMKKKDKQLDFSNQVFHIGIDVHKNSWQVSIRCNNIHLKTFVMNPDAEELSNYMNKHYPGGIFYSVYESGFSGYNDHRKLLELGIKNIIVSPNQIPTSSKERINKSDKRDCRKLARELEHGTLKGIYIPTVFQQEIRSLCRLRYQTVRKQVRVKNQIKSYLYFYGQKISQNSEVKHWSRRFIEELKTMEFSYEPGKEQLDNYIEELFEQRKRLLRIHHSLKKQIKENELEEDLELLMSIPGIGFITGVTLLTEIMEIKRFKSAEHFASYIGLVPVVQSSGETRKVLGISLQHNRYLRSLMIRSAWIAIRKDPAMTLAYNNYTKRMSKQKAIIRIAKKLLNRIYYVLKNRKKYINSVT